MGNKTKEDCVRCHRRVIELVPRNLEPRRLLDIWRPAGMALAYAHLDLSEEVFHHLDTLRTQIGDNWGIEDHFQFTLARSNQYRERESWNEVVREGRIFVDWAKALSPDDPRITLPSLNLTDKPDDPEKEKVGEWMRWWTVCCMLGKIVAIAQHNAENNTSEIFAELDWALEQHESVCRHIRIRSEATPEDADLQRASNEAKKRLPSSYTKAGEGAYRSGRYADAIRYYAREEELSGTLEEHGPICLAASLVAIGHADEARERLRNTSSRQITNGQWRAYYEQFREFDRVRDNPEFITIIKKWEQIQALGQQ